MTPEISAIFEPLRLAITEQNYDDSDVFDLIGAAAEQSPITAVAYALHMRDFIRENSEREFTWAEAVAEVYRRTYFDEEQATKYGTQEVCKAGIDTMRNLAEYLTGSLKMDAIATHPGQPSLFSEGQSH